MDLFLGLTHLSEEVPGETLLQHTLLRDEVEEVLAGLGALHHDDEGVVALEVVDEPDDAGDAGHAVHETDLQGDAVHADLGGRGEGWQSDG